MPTPLDLVPVFAALKPLLEAHAAALKITRDADGAFYLNTTHLMPNKQPLSFGGVEIKKNYVSFHLIPVYVFPDLLESVSPALKKRMQGKSCFNFKAVDAALFTELQALTAAGLARYREKGYV